MSPVVRIMLLFFSAISVSVGQSTLQVYVTSGVNTSSITPGGTFNITAGNLGQPSLANVTVQYAGVDTASITAVTLTGTSEMTLVSLPAFPVVLTPGGKTNFSVQYVPSSANAVTGQLSIGFTENSQQFSFPFALIGAPPSTSGTANFTVGYTLADGNARALANGTTISFPSVDINANTSAAVQILNQGTGSGTLNGVTIAGNGFRLYELPLLPATIAAGQGVTFSIVFAPTQVGTFTGTFRIDLSSGLSISGALTGSTAPSKVSLFYLDPSTNSVMPLQNGSNLPFPDTLTGSSSNVTLVVANSGAGTGFVNSITLGSGSSSTFQLLSLPSFPAPIGPSAQLSVGVRFSPQQQQVFSGTLLCVIDGNLTTINLSGRGIGSQFTYIWSDQTNTTAVTPGGSIAIANTTVGQTSSVAVSVTNTGSADGQISVLGITGQGFSLDEAPVLPFTLHPNASLRFNLSFTPAQPGPVTGRLTIGSDTFSVTATALGSVLIYTFGNAAGTTPVSDGGTIVFTPVPVGGNTDVQVSIQNTGTSSSTISTITLATPSTIFGLQTLPALPLNLAPGATIVFPIQFAPNETTTATATLRINNATFTLSGTGTRPAPLPSYDFQGPSGTQQAAQQPMVGLSLSSPYPLPLSGTLTLTFVSSAFTDDPAIQFATGGRTANFSIPANSTQAIFNGSSTAIPFQTGTTAGTIAITPSFALGGGFDLTPDSPPQLTLTIPSAPPQLLKASVSILSLTAFTVALAGYTTPRNLRQLDFQFTPKTGDSFVPSHVTIDISSDSANWFLSTASQGFGGEFLLTVPFVLQNGSSTDDLVHRLQAIAITATDDSGTSSALSVQVQ